MMSLPVIYGSNPNKILEFYETLSPKLQALETTGKIKEVNGYVRMRLDKLEGIRGDFVRTDDNWQDWKFPHQLEALRKWNTRNPPKPVDERPPQGENIPIQATEDEKYQVRQHDQRRRPCVYCESSDHQSVNCDKVTTIHERRKQLNLKQLCFTCTGANHKASECRCSSTCKFCKRRHHSSICVKESQQPEHMLVAFGRGSVTYPTVVVSVDGIQCRPSRLCWHFFRHFLGKRAFFFVFS